MEKIELKIKQIAHEGAETILPKRATEGSAGLDLYAAIEKPAVIRHGQLAMIPTGVAVAIPDGAVGLICARSGLAVKHGIALSNGVGVIDSDYRGELTIGLCNLSETPYTLSPGERIAQLLLMPVYAAALVETETLDETARAAGGFGSTGKF